MLDRIDTSKKLSKGEYRQRMPELQARLFDVQRRCWDEQLGVVVVVEGWSAASKGAVIKKLTERLEPRANGWAAHAAPFAFETGAQRYTHGIERFLHGSPAVACYAQASAGYELVLEAGVEAIRRHSIALTEGLRADLLARGFVVNSPEDPARRGGTLTVGLNADEDGPGFVRALEARGVLVDHRPEAGVRVSPHFYTRMDELTAFAEAMSELRESGSWRDFVDSSQPY